MECFDRGADGVMVLGCHPGDCHYLFGNTREEGRVQEAWELLDLLGIGRERLVLQWISAAEGERFGAAIDNFCTLLRSRGPLRRQADG
jgi:F420-non-reducing hydrogenase iron-sulfur subunit